MANPFRQPPVQGAAWAMSGSSGGSIPVRTMGPPVPRGELATAANEVLDVNLPPDGRSVPVIAGSEEPAASSEQMTLVLQSSTEYYAACNENKKTLLTLCIGLGVGDWNEEPYSKSKGKAAFKPTNGDLIKELKRRYAILRLAERTPSVKEPRPRGWKTDQLLGWLNTYPIEDASDVTYIKAKEQAFRSVFSRALEDEESTTLDGFYTLRSFLRMYHCLLVPEVKVAFLHRNDIEARPGTDARNYEDRPASFKEVFAKQYNEAAWKPMSLVIPSLHHDFHESIELYKDIEVDVTPEQIYNKLVNCKSKMVKVIDAWERSGSGDCQRKDALDTDEVGEPRDENHPRFGRTPFASVDYLLDDDYDEVIAGDNRHAFLGNNPSHILYVWHLSDEYDLLNNLMEKIPKDMAADGTKAPSARATRNKRSRDDDELQQRTTTALMFGQTFQNFQLREGLTHASTSIEKLDERARSLRQEIFKHKVMKHQEPDMSELCDDEIKKVEKELAAIKTQKTLQQAREKELQQSLATGEASFLEHQKKSTELVSAARDRAGPNAAARATSQAGPNVAARATSQASGSSVPSGSQTSGSSVPSAVITGGRGSPATSQLTTTTTN